ncbi:hypothetical protein JCM17846_13230 [Iodidimonas nitroreducens]|uniref:Uncharacterized protein n=1 Tax=Iodidimonas nitroreducens TaxID=1236968 RepID=A0A5A7N5R2_9PROT|nr:hypothetical protein [Iodidimonas nitroreducens]GER03641.1 hypothetical protein JCM17846_13230 [Iodidimonas nitroreducens]
MTDKPWLQHYPQEIDWGQTIKARPLHDLLVDAAKEWPDHVHMASWGAISPIGKAPIWWSGRRKAFKSWG